MLRCQCSVICSVSRLAALARSWPRWVSSMNPTSLLRLAQQDVGSSAALLAAAASTFELPCSAARENLEALEVLPSCQAPLELVRVEGEPILQRTRALLLEAVKLRSLIIDIVLVYFISKYK